MVMGYGCRVCGGFIENPVTCARNGNVWWECLKCNATRAGKTGRLRRELDAFLSYRPYMKKKLLADLTQEQITQLWHLLAEEHHRRHEESEEPP